MSLDSNTPSRTREYKHVFAGPRRITATIRIDLPRATLLHTGDFAITRCEWDGSRERQPSAELYSEFKERVDFVFSDMATKTGANLLYVFDLPAPASRIEVWLYESGRKPRLTKTLPNPFQRPLSEALAGMPPTHWEEDQHE